VSFGHYRRYDPGRLEAVWAGLPMVVRMLSYYNSRLYPLVRLVRTASRWRRRPSGLQGTDLWMPSTAMNALLRRVFEGESRRLTTALNRSGPSGFRRGVSLMAVVQRQEGSVVPRFAPEGMDHGYRGTLIGEPP
jgi:hypothetical protein